MAPRAHLDVEAALPARLVGVDEHGRMLLGLERIDVPGHGSPVELDREFEQIMRGQQDRGVLHFLLL